VEEKQVDINDRIGLGIAGIISLAVGLMFFIPGICLATSIIVRFIHNELPDSSIVFITVFLCSLGTILLLLAYQFFTGKICKQHMPTPLLAVVSAGFVAISIYFALSAYVFKSSPTGSQTGRAIGGSMSIGCLGLYFAYKRVRGASNTRSDHDRA
jgi:drug/metabolite transporter (DMT)-like permease